MSTNHLINNRRTRNAKHSFNQLFRQVEPDFRRQHIRASDDDLRNLEVRLGTPFQSGIFTVRHDEVYLHGVLLGKLQYKVPVGKEITHETPVDVTISEVAGARFGDHRDWLIGEAKGALLFVPETEIKEAFDFNEARKGKPLTVTA